MSERKRKELELWYQWKETGDDMYLHELLKSMEPIIQKEVNKWKGNLPNDMIQAKAKMLAIKAFKTYSPEKGALTTHLVNQLKPISRFVYTYQNVARIPSEVRITKINALKDAVNRIMAEKGRTPTLEEIADALGISKKELNKFLRELHPDFLESLLIAPTPPTIDDETRLVIEDFYNSLSPVDKLIFEHSVGWGKKQLSISELAKKANLTEHEVKQRRNQLAKKFVDYINQISDAYYIEPELSRPSFDLLESYTHRLMREDFEGGEL